MESSPRFGGRLYAEALRRGLERAKTVVGLTEGARYNLRLIQPPFPQPVHLVDWFPADAH